jgi:hypothetical protein
MCARLCVCVYAGRWTRARGRPVTRCCSDGDIAPPLVVVGVGSDVKKEPFLAVPVDGPGKTVGGKLIPGGPVGV